MFSSNIDFGFIKAEKLTAFTCLSPHSHQLLVITMVT